MLLAAGKYKAFHPPICQTTDKHR